MSHKIPKYFKDQVRASSPELIECTKVVFPELETAVNLVQEAIKKEIDFYLVWGHGIPSRRHTTYQEAEQEALRLLGKDPKQVFYVMRCCAEIRIGEAVIKQNVPAIPQEFALKKVKATTKKTTTKKEK